MKAESLRCLTASFLSCHLEHSSPYSDAHYGTLCLLLTLSRAPLHSNFEPTMPTAVPAEEEDDFDWTGYLMEGIAYSPQHSSDSEVRCDSLQGQTGLAIVTIGPKPQ